MNNKIKLFDVVALTDDLPERPLQRGQVALGGIQPPLHTPRHVEDPA